MIIRSLRLKNVRSYREASLDFLPGKTLFEGDIGSGKSTILMAIEFALFGLGSERGGSLLRTGEERGSVVLVLDVDGSEYKIIRNLVRRSGKVQQAEGEIIGPLGRDALSPADLKERLLDILGFREPPDPKSQSVIYRYAVYTPQEAMKAILAMPSDLRLQTLRKAFGIEDYKVAKEHASEVARRIGQLVHDSEQRSAGLPELKDKIAERIKMLGAKREELAAAQLASERKERLVKSLEGEMEALRAQEKELAAARERVQLLEKSLASKTRERQKAEAGIEQREKEVLRLGAQVRSEEAVESPTAKKQEEISGEIADLRTHVRVMASLLDRADAKMDDYRAIRETGRCSTCDREADASEFVEKERAKALEKERLSADIREHELALSGLEVLLKGRRDYDSLGAMLLEHRERLADSTEELERMKSEAQEGRQALEETEDNLYKAKREIEMLSDVSERVKRINGEADTAEKELQLLRGRVVASGRDLEHLQQEIGDLERESEGKEASRKKAASLRQYGIWIEDYFVPTLEVIERQVLTSINQDFNEHFQGWFSTLVEDQSKEARVDENFVPFVEQDGYEQDADYLSGGERTSLALAYRLAMNQVVQRVSIGMKSNLLILDEPTDGFSREQLGKMREILDEVESPQVILVSHDKELESFADQIFRVVKTNGESRVLAGS